MPAPTVPYKILAEGYEVEGGEGTGLRAVVPYLVTWNNAFVFYDQIMLKTSATTVGPITYNLPYMFPAFSLARIYARRATIKPVGSNGVAYPDGYGLAPGEFFSHAIITVTFESPGYPTGSFDDPFNLFQLDPSNPITQCEMRVTANTRRERERAPLWEFDDGKLVDADFPMKLCEPKLILNFPRVPYLPWSRIRPFINKINDDVLFFNPRGSMLFDDFDTRTTIDDRGLLATSVELIFDLNPRGIDWNKMTKKGATDPALIRRVDGHARPYEYVNFAGLFLSS